MNHMPIHNFYTEEQISLTAWEVEEGDHVFDMDNTNIVQIDSSDDDGTFPTRADWNEYAKTLEENGLPSGVIAYWDKELRNTKYVFARQVGVDAYMEIDFDELEFEFDVDFIHYRNSDRISAEITFKTKFKSK